MVSMDFTELEGMLRPILQGAVQVGQRCAAPARTSAEAALLRKLQAFECRRCGCSQNHSDLHSLTEYVPTFYLTGCPVDQRRRR
jgi:hypothetical protein